MSQAPAPQSQATALGYNIPFSQLLSCPCFLIFAPLFSPSPSFSSFFFLSVLPSSFSFLSSPLYLIFFLLFFQASQCPLRTPFLFFLSVIIPSFSIFPLASSLFFPVPAELFPIIIILISLRVHSTILDLVFHVQVFFKVNKSVSPIFPATSLHKPFPSSSPLVGARY